MENFRIVIIFRSTMELYEQTTINKMSGLFGKQTTITRSHDSATHVRPSADMHTCKWRG